jgi:hypothetical protein
MISYPSSAIMKKYQERATQKNGGQDFEVEKLRDVPQHAQHALHLTRKA